MIVEKPTRQAANNKWVEIEGDIKIDFKKSLSWVEDFYVDLSVPI